MMETIQDVLQLILQADDIKYVKNSGILNYGLEVTKKIVFLWDFLCYTYTTYRFQRKFTGGKNGKSRTI